MIADLSTESVNEESKSIDVFSAQEIVKIINEQDKVVANAIQPSIDKIACASIEISKRFNMGGRIIYIGAGSSGRIGVLDAVELQPTYNVPSERAFGIIAGGIGAMFQAVEGIEDNYEEGENDILQANVSKLDVVIGIAASGRTPYTLGALNKANDLGAYTIGITNNLNSEMSKIVECSIEVPVGSEVVSGSTRMKAGTSQKMVVNMLSTTAMILSGKVYDNYMVHVQATNEKLVLRAINMIHAITGLSIEDSTVLFNSANYSVANSIVMELGDVTLEVAEQALIKENGNVRKAIQFVTGLSK